MKVTARGRAQEEQLPLVFHGSIAGSRKGSNVKTIQLTKNQVAIVDDWWFEVLSQHKRKAIWNKDTKSYYACRDVWNPITKKTKAQYMHRIVAKTPEGMICDHIHHNTLDNQEKELRNLTPAQSNMNMRLRRDNRLGVRGVRQTDSGSYTARLTIGRKTLLCKNFDNLEDAIEARKNAEKKHFGEFAMEVL